MKVKSTFFVIHEVHPENYEGITDIREMTLEDMEAPEFFEYNDFVLMDSVPYDDPDDNIEGRHEVKMQAIELGREL